MICFCLYFFFYLFNLRDALINDCTTFIPQQILMIKTFLSSLVFLIHTLYIKDVSAASAEVA